MTKVAQARRLVRLDSARGIAGYATCHRRFEACQIEAASAGSYGGAELEGHRHKSPAESSRKAIDFRADGAPAAKTRTFLSLSSAGRDRTSRRRCII